LAFLGLDGGKQLVKVGLADHVAADAVGVGAKLLHGGVQLGLLVAGEEDVGAFGDKALGCAQANSGRTARNEGYFTG